MKTSYPIFLAIVLAIAASLSTANAQSIIDGSFENCSSTGAVTATPDFIQTNYFTPCAGTTYFFGTGQAFYSDGSQISSYGSGSCFYYSPTPSNGIRNIGFGKDATLAVKLTANLVPGNCYMVTFEGMNSPGDDGSGSCSSNTGSAAYQVGVSNSATSFGTSVGTSSLLAPSVSYTYTSLSVSFMAPAGANDYITIRLADQTNVESMLFLDNMAISSLSCITLPITLADFSATKNTNCSIQLQWKTAIEINSDYFEIQRSDNGSVFTTIATINSKNNSVGSQYQMVDNNTIAGNNYYRLIMVDHDGRKKYSTVINVMGCKSNNINIYPNPTSNILNINGIKKGDLIQIVNTVGQVVLLKTASENKETLSIKQLPNNIYTVIILNTQTGQKITQKITKQ